VARRAGLERRSERPQLDNVRLLDPDGLADRFGAVSFVATLDEASRGALRALAGGGREVEILRRCDQTPDPAAGRNVNVPHVLHDTPPRRSVRCSLRRPPPRQLREKCARMSVR
jgi:hypothetical protein